MGTLEADETRPLRFTDSGPHASPHSVTSGPRASPHSGTSGLGTSPSDRDPRGDPFRNYREHFPRQRDTYERTADYVLALYDAPSSSSDEVVRPPRRRPPDNLGLELAPTKLRSSLKKHAKKPSFSGGSSGGGTPTNPTPPDSLASETDSSYVSARDASSGSQSRVRFSPETMQGPSRHS